MKLEVGAITVPSDWIKGKADDETRRNEEARQRELKRQRDTELIKALGPAFVENLRKVVNEDIAAWNENFSDRIINGATKITNGFNVAKLGFPRGIAQVAFNPATLRIEVKLTRSTAAGDEETYTTDGYFRLEANPDGKDIHMLDRFKSEHVLPSGFSRIILESIAEQQSHHSI